MLTSISCLLLALSPSALRSAVAPQERLVRNTYDRIVLTDGKEVRGRVLYEDDEVVVLRPGSKKEKEYPRSEVAEIQSVERSVKGFLERVAALEDPDDMAALEALALYCDESGLPEEARLTRLFMLTRDATNESAWTGLGGRKASKGWQLKAGKKWRTWEELQELHASWKERWKLRSTHFVLESDLPLADNIRALITLEEFYRVFYEALTPTLRLYAFDELPLVQITKEPKNYPAPPIERDAWFSSLYNTLNVLATESPDARLIVHEFTQGMLYNAFSNTLRNDGQIAPWARKGLAQWFAGGAKQGELRTEIDLEQRDMELLKRHAQASDPIALKKLLAMAPMEFETGRNAELGGAEAYTLLLFLARGADRKYRDGLLEFIMASYRGKSGVSEFRKLVAQDLDAFEAEWTAWVKEQAGG